MRSTLENDSIAFTFWRFKVDFRSYLHINLMRFRHIKLIWLCEHVFFFSLSLSLFLFRGPGIDHIARSLPSASSAFDFGQMATESIAFSNMRLNIFVIWKVFRACEYVSMFKCLFCFSSFFAFFPDCFFSRSHSISFSLSHSLTITRFFSHALSLSIHVAHVCCSCCCVRVTHYFSHATQPSNFSAENQPFV